MMTTTKQYIDITVSGVTNTGKSRLIFLFKNFLRENGFDVEFDGGLDYQSESNFDIQMSKISNDDTIRIVRERSKIILKDELLSREEYRQININNPSPGETQEQYIIVTVSGVINSGKSSLTFLLKNFLRDNGFIVEFNGGSNFQTETEFDDQMSKISIYDSIRIIKEKSKITLIEEQLKRNHYEPRK